MTQDIRNRLKVIMDREKLMSTNAEGCPACGRKFELGNPAVLACGPWGGGLKLIHEHEATFDESSARYIENSCYKAKTGP